MIVLSVVVLNYYSKEYLKIYAKKKKMAAAWISFRWIGWILLEMITAGYFCESDVKNNFYV